METTHRRTNRQLILFAAFAGCLMAAHLNGHIGRGQARIPMPGVGGKTQADILSDEGPQFPAAYVTSNIRALVFARGGAPLVVEYQLGNKSRATVTLAAKAKEGKEEGLVTYRLESTGDQIKQVIFKLPEEVFGSKPVVTMLAMKAENLDQTAEGPPDFALYGLGMGEKAVGSMGIDRLNFQPDRVRATAKEKVAYGFHSRFDFDEAHAEFHFMGHTGSGEPANRSVKGEKIGGIRRGESVSREWNGKNQKGEVSKGRHQLVVKAWYGEKKGGDWTRAWSRQRVLVE